jgi:hypothetical protein
MIAREAVLTNAQFMALQGYDIEIVEVYNGAASIPGIYGGSDASCGVIAVWLRRGNDPAPVEPVGDRTIVARIGGSVGTAAYRFAGPYAPGAGAGLEATLLWELGYGVSAGLRVMHATASLSAATMADLAAADTEPGSQPLVLRTAGVEARLPVLPDRFALRPVVSVRGLRAQRSFNPYARPDARPEVSRGWGGGVGVGFDLRVRNQLGVHAGVGHDRIRFERFAGIDLPSRPTAATWDVTTLRLVGTWSRH